LRANVANLCYTARLMFAPFSNSFSNGGFYSRLGCAV